MPSVPITNKFAKRSCCKKILHRNCLKKVISEKMKIKYMNYVPSRRIEGKTASRRDDKLVTETINIHNPTVGKDKNSQLIVTMDRFNPNTFLAKKLMTECLVKEEDIVDKPKEKEITLKERDTAKESVNQVKPQESTIKDKSQGTTVKSKGSIPKEKEIHEMSEEATNESPKKRLSSESTERNTQVDIKLEDAENSKENNSKLDNTVEKRKSNQSLQERKNEETSPPVKKRRIPIVFDLDKKEKAGVQERERTESVGSDDDVIVTTAINLHIYDALPPYTKRTMRSGAENRYKWRAAGFDESKNAADKTPHLLSEADLKSVWCRAFPLCRYGDACAFQHPRCKFAPACTRRGCVYSHTPPAHPLASPTPAISSHVVPAAIYKSITARPLPNKYYPSCSNPVCSFCQPRQPKACRYGAACFNKRICNFYHGDLPSSK